MGYSVEELESLLPHRPPFRWVDEVVRSEALPGGGVQGHCRILLDGEAHYFSSTGSFRPTAFFEMICQAYCFSWVVSEGRRSFSELYLTSLRDGKLHQSIHLQGGEVLDIFTLSGKILKEFCAFSGEVRLKGEEGPLATAQMRAYYKFSDAI